MASPDTRYLKQRGIIWYVQKAVPPRHHHRFGPTYQKSLGTSDLREAQRLRWPHIHAQEAKFEKADEDEGLSSDEIEEYAHEEYRRIASLERLDFEPQSGIKTVDDKIEIELGILNEAIEYAAPWVVGDKIQEVEERSGAIRNFSKWNEAGLAVVSDSWWKLVFGVAPDHDGCSIRRRGQSAS